MSEEKEIIPVVTTADVDAKAPHSTLLGCDLRRELDYISKKEHIFDYTAYRNANINGRLVTGDEVSFKLQYCAGGAYLRGFANDVYFAIIYRDTQGFQVFIAASYRELDEMKRMTFSEMPGEQYQVYKRLMEYLTHKK